MFHADFRRQVSENVPFRLSWIGGKKVRTISSVGGSKWTRDFFVQGEYETSMTIPSIMLDGLYQNLKFILLHSLSHPVPIYLKVEVGTKGSMLIFVVRFPKTFHSGFRELVEKSQNHFFSWGIEMNPRFFRARRVRNVHDHPVNHAWWSVRKL